MSDVHGELDLHAFDVNLLVAFDALAREGSVTRAAERAGVTQSAMSHTLRRLREIVGDPLLVRGRSGMALTPRAEAMVIPVRSGLSALRRALTGPAEFSPAELTRTIRLVSPDSFDILILPPLLQALQVEAPGLDIAVMPHPGRLSDALETGDVDLAVLPVLLDEQPFVARMQPGGDLRQRRLLRDTMRCFVRSDHPIAKRRRLTPRAYAELSHILVSPTGEGPGVVDRFLADEGLERRIALRVPMHSSALAIVAETDLALTAPQSLERSPAAANLVSFKVPLPIPDHAIVMVWHPRFSEDPAHRWLRGVFLAVTRARLRP